MSPIAAKAQSPSGSRWDGKSAAGVEIAEVELGQEPEQGFVEGFRQVSQVVLDFGSVERRLFGEPALVASGVVVDRSFRRQRQRDTAVSDPCFMVLSGLMVLSALRVRGKPKIGASWYTASRICTGGLLPAGRRVRVGIRCSHNELLRPGAAAGALPTQAKHAAAVPASIPTSALVSDAADNPGGRADHHRPGRHIPCYHGAGGNH